MNASYIVAGCGRRARELMAALSKKRNCPLCGWRGYRFEPTGRGAARRKDALCPACGGLERQRAAKLLLQERISKGQKTLHIAPERSMIPWLISMSSEYVSVDIENDAMLKMDVRKLEFPDESKSLIWCSHVLEHIDDDVRVLSEAFRVLRPGGMVVLQVPIRGEETLEDSSICTPEGRFTAFLQEDHVRFYGYDFKSRIESVGFSCMVFSIDELPKSDITLYSLDHTFFRDVFVGIKQNQVAI